MQYTAKHRYADVGPRKIRPFADLIRGKNVDEALQLLRFYHNRGAKLLEAVVQSAYGNADDQEMPGPGRTRRERVPRRRRADVQADSAASPRHGVPIKRRMSHIIVTLSDPEDLTPAARRRPKRRAPATPETPATPTA